MWVSVAPFFSLPYLVSLCFPAGGISTLSSAALKPLPIFGFAIHALEGGGVCRYRFRFAFLGTVFSAIAVAALEVSEDTTLTVSGQIGYFGFGLVLFILSQTFYIAALTGGVLYHTRGVHCVGFIAVCAMLLKVVRSKPLKVRIIY